MAISQKNHKRHSKNKYSKNIKKIGGGRDVTLGQHKREQRSREAEARKAAEEAAAAAAETKGIYIFPDTIKQLYVCSDFEGANVFKFTGDIQGIPEHMHETENIEEIEKKKLVKKSTFDQKKELVSKEIENNFNTERNDGIIGEITNPETALAYTGDLFDNRPNSIKLLKNMIGMKTDTPKRVIIIGGNRDFNKLRLGIELFLVKPDGESIFSNPSTTLQGILDDLTIRFRTQNVNEFRYINWNSPKGDPVLDDYGKSIDDELEKSYGQKFYARVFSMLTETMGARYEAYKVELREILDSLEEKINIPPGNEDDFICKFFCILSMIMCFDYSQDEIVNQHPIYTSLSKYAGLIYDYLGYMHPMAYFNINGKNGLLSHSGFPDLGITSPLGYDPTITSNEVPLETILGDLLADKKTLLKQYNTCKENNLTVEQIPDIVIRYIQIGGGNPFPNIKFTPIIGNNAIDIIKNKSSMYFGGNDMSEKWLDKYSKANPGILTKFKFVLDPTGNKENLHYHIFGHMPQPFFPSVALSDNNTTTHIALDICRADFGKEGNNNYSFTMLKITGNGYEQGVSDPDELFGRTRLGVITKGNKELQDHVIYYKEPLGTFIKNDSNEIKFKDYKIIKVESGPPKFDRIVETIHFSSFQVGGKKTRRKRRSYKRPRSHKRHQTRKHKTQRRRRRKRH